MSWSSATGKGIEKILKHCDSAFFDGGKQEVLDIESHFGIERVSVGEFQLGEFLQCCLCEQVGEHEAESVRVRLLRGANQGKLFDAIE